MVLNVELPQDTMLCLPMAGYIAAYCQVAQTIQNRHFVVN